MSCVNKEPKSKVNSMKSGGTVTGNEFPTQYYLIVGILVKNVEKITKTKIAFRCAHGKGSFHALNGTEFENESKLNQL